MSVETISTAAALVDARHRLDGDAVRQRLHQRRRVPHPDPAHRSWTRPGQGGSAVVDAELRHGGHPHRMGLRRRPGRRTHRAGTRLGTDRGRGVRGGIGALTGRRRRVSPSRRHGCSQQQLGQRPVGGRLVPAAAARPGDGYPADGPAAGSRVGRLGDSPLGREPRCIGRAVVSRDRVCGRRRRVRGGRERSATTAARRGRRARPGQPVPRLGDAVAHPRGVRASGRAAGRRVDVHAGVADDRPRLVGGIGGRAGHGFARCSAPPVGSRQDGGRTSWVRGCGRSAPSRWRPPFRWACWR